MTQKYTIKIPAFDIEVVQNSDDTDNIVADPFATEPDMTDNRNSNGDVLLPYQYSKNGWDVTFDLDITEKTANGIFILSINPSATPNRLMPETRLVLQNSVGGKKNINIYDASKNTYLPLNQVTTLNLKDNFVNRKLEYQPGDWGDNSYIYLFMEGHCSGVFYIFHADAGAGYIRI